MKPPSPLVGFNTNVRHRGRTFHIQTEDSGVKRPHVITHLFADGGRILKTARASYAEHVDALDLEGTVRDLMQHQHKAMFMALRGGEYDHLFDDRAPKPPVAMTEAARAPTPILPAPASLAERELSALERGGTPPLAPFDNPLARELPPPPAAVLGRRADGRALDAPAHASDRPPSAPPSSHGGHYAPPREPAIFTTAPGPEPPDAPAQRNPPGDAALDAVILAYLSDELDA